MTDKNDQASTSPLPGQLPLFPESVNTPSVPAERELPERQFSKYVVYVDESGDHGLESIDPNYPVFVLAFCVFHKNHYAQRVVPSIEAFKFKHFGHDLVVLHETDIRKEKGRFRFDSRQHKELFLNELTSIIETSNFILIGCIIDKNRLRERSSNPYHLALGFCLETLYELVEEKGQDGTTTHVVVECRGKREDNELELEFRRVCAGENKFGRTLPFVRRQENQLVRPAIGGSRCAAYRVISGQAWPTESSLRLTNSEVLLQRRSYAGRCWLRRMGPENSSAPRKRKAPVIAPRP